VLARFVARYPEVRVECDLTNRKVDLVGEGFDLALRASMGRERDTSLVRRRLLSSETRAYAAPAYLARRGTPRELGEAGHEWLGFAPAKHLHRGQAPRVVGNDMLFMLEATRAGIGIGLLPNFIADPWLATGGLVAVLPRERLPTGALVLLYPAAAQVPRKVTAFRDVLLATLRRS
jgi:DNA-binding transcriptional LysR family regulator